MQTARSSTSDLAAPIDDAPFAEARAQARRTTTSRVLTREVRAQVGLPRVTAPRYPWGRVAFFTALAVALLLLLHQGWLAWLVGLTALVFLPFLRSMEHRDALRREALYLHGEEAVARVLEVEPAGGGRRDHVVRFEFLAGERLVSTAVVGPPIARRGLRPGDDICVVFDRARPERCLIVAKITRSRPSSERDDYRAPNPPMIGDPIGGCGGGCGCAAGGCGASGGGCGGGGCG